MKYLKLAAVVVLSLIGMAGAGVYLLISTVAGGPCQIEKLAEFPSPDGRYVAAAFVPNCGATVRYFTVVNLRKAREPLDLDPQSGVLSFYGIDTSEIAWIPEGDIHIRFPASVQIFRQKFRWEDINIQYTRN